ncbi:hypothetical protein Ancab_031983 [Ancistrocladus abbreviatus]
MASKDKDADKSNEVINDDECDDSNRRLPFGNRFLAIALGMRVEDPTRTSDQLEYGKSHSYGTPRIDQIGARRDKGRSHTLRPNYGNDQGQGSRVSI